MDTKKEILKRVRKIVLNELKETDFPNRSFQAVIVLHPIRTIDAQGNEKTYNNTVILKIIRTRKLITLSWLTLGLLRKISNRITSEIEGVSKVVYDITRAEKGG